jgi:hypothetical protein
MKSLKLGGCLFLLAGPRLGLNIFGISGALPTISGTRYLVRMLVVHRFDLWGLSTWSARGPMLYAALQAVQFLELSAGVAAKDHLPCSWW